MAGMRIAKASKEDIEEMIEYFKKKEAKNIITPSGWRRVIWGCEILTENCCDPLENHLEFSPYLDEQHVAPEQ